MEICGIIPSYHGTASFFSSSGCWVSLYGILKLHFSTVSHRYFNSHAWGNDFSLVENYSPRLLWDWRWPFLGKTQFHLNLHVEWLRKCSLTLISDLNATYLLIAHGYITYSMYNSMYGMSLHTTAYTLHSLHIAHLLISTMANHIQWVSTTIEVPVYSAIATVSHVCQTDVRQHSAIFLL